MPLSAPLLMPLLLPMLGPQSVALPPTRRAPPPAEMRPAPPSAAELEARLLEAYDWGRPLPPASEDPRRPALAWLRAAAAFDPQGPFPAPPSVGSIRREAEALRSLAGTPLDRLPARLKTQPLRLSGTALALWRWGQAQVRAGRFPTRVRQAWEDRLLAEGPALTRGYALRHALCWALAEQDETRFALLRGRLPAEAEPSLIGFQRLFGLVGGPSPVLRLWRLPALAYEDLRLDQLGARRIWIRPAEEGPLPELPGETAWIIPSPEGRLDPRSASLPEPLAAEGRALAGRLGPGGRPTYFAPSRGVLEPLGLTWFPILIELDGLGNLRSVRMGDAAPERP